METVKNIIDNIDWKNFGIFILLVGAFIVFIAYQYVMDYLASRPIRNAKSIADLIIEYRRINRQYEFYEIYRRRAVHLSEDLILTKNDYTEAIKILEAFEMHTKLGELKDKVMQRNKQFFWDLMNKETPAAQSA